MRCGTNAHITELYYMAHIRPHGALFVAVEQIAFSKSFKVSFIFYNSYYYNLSRLEILNELY